MKSSNGRYLSFLEYKRKLDDLKFEASKVAVEIIDLDRQLGSRRGREEMAFGEAFEHLVGIALRLSHADEEVLWQFALSPKINRGEMEAVHDVVDYLVGDECYEASTHLSNKKLDQVYKQLIAVRRAEKRRVSKYGRLNVVVLRKPPYTNRIWDRVRRDVNVLGLKEINQVSDDIVFIGDVLQNKSIAASDVERLSVLLYNIHQDIQDGKLEDIELKIKHLADFAGNSNVRILEYEAKFGKLRHKSVPSRTCFYEDSGELKQTCVLDRKFEYPENELAILRRCWEDMGENAEDFEMDPEKLRRVKRHLEGLLGKEVFYQSLDEEGVVCEEIEVNGTVRLEYSVFGVPLAITEQKAGGDDIEALSYNPNNGVGKAMHRNGLDTYFTIDPRKFSSDLAGHGLIVREDFSEIYRKGPEMPRVHLFLIDRGLRPPNGLEQKDFYEKVRDYIASNLN